jgi:hypothetical protein
MTVAHRDESNNVADDPDATAFRWAGRPLRNLTDQELAQAIHQRQLAARDATTSMGQQLAEHALERLNAELDGRMKRRSA